MLSLWGLHEQQTNHFLFSKFILKKRHSVDKGSTGRSLTGISSPT